MVLGWPPFKNVSDSHALHPRWPPLLKIEISSNGQNEKLTTDDGRKKPDGKSSHGLWPGELKRGQKGQTMI
jgi:hypothetical protein